LINWKVPKALGPDCDRCSFILPGSRRLAARIRLPQNESLKQRIGFSHPLCGFTIDDATDCGDTAPTILRRINTLTEV